MCRQIAQLAEIIRAGDNPAAKHMMPHAIHDHARRERIVFHVRHALGELQAAALLRLERRGVQCIEKASFHHLRGHFVITAREERRVLRIRLDHARHAHRHRQRLLDFAILFQQGEHLLRQLLLLQMCVQSLRIRAAERVGLPACKKLFRRRFGGLRLRRCFAILRDARIREHKPAPLIRFVLRRHVCRRRHLQEDLVTLPEFEIQAAPREFFVLRVLEFDSFVNRSGARVILHDVFGLHAAISSHAKPKRAALALEPLREHHRALFRAQRIRNEARWMNAQPLFRHRKLPRRRALHAEPF